MTMTPTKHRCLWMSKRTARAVTCWYRPTATAFSMFLTAAMANLSRASPFVQKLNWATVIDPSGGPLLSGRVPTAQGTYICPGHQRRYQLFFPSYNPDTGFLYVMALESCKSIFQQPKAVYARARLTTVRHKASTR